MKKDVTEKMNPKNGEGLTDNRDKGFTKKKRGYKLLKDDLDQWIDGFENNPEIPERVKEKYRRIGKKAGITHRSLGYADENNPNPLVLEFDGESVGSLSSASTRNYWDYNDSHIFAPMPDMVRFGLFMCMDLYHLICLVLKSEWERYYGCQIKGWRHHGRGNQESLLDCFKDVDDMRRHMEGFEPDVDAFFDIINQFSNLTGQIGYDKNTFRTLVREMVYRDLHFFANDSEELHYFIIEENNRLQLAKEGSPVEQKEYFELIGRYTELLYNNDSVYIQLEDQWLKNAEVERRYFVIFGKLEEKLFELTHEKNTLVRRILLKRTDPALTIEQLDEMVEEEMKKALLELEDLRFRVMIAPLLEKNSAGGSPVTAEYIAQQDDERRKLARRIAFLIHPDRLSHNPKYQRLTEDQKAELKRIFLEITKKIDPDELGFPKGFLEAEKRTVDGLLRVLNRIEQVLKNAGVDVKVDFDIQGETLPEQMAWLKMEIRFLEAQIIEAKENLTHLAADSKTTQRKNILQIPEKHQTIQEEMASEIETFTGEIETLKAQLAALF